LWFLFYFLLWGCFFCFFWVGWGGVVWGANEPRISLLGGSLGLTENGWTTRLANLVRWDLFLPAFELREDTAPAYFAKIRGSGCRFIIGYA
jgi:hypothetical protein